MKNTDKSLIIVGGWINNVDKKEHLLKTVESLRSQCSYPILFVSNYEIDPDLQNIFDYYIYDKNNPVIDRKKISEKGLSLWRWYQNDFYKINALIEPCVGYSIWKNFQTAFYFANYLKKENIIYVESNTFIDSTFIETFDNPLSEDFEYCRVKFREDIGGYRTNYFSIKTNIALKSVSLINSEDEYIEYERQQGLNGLEFVFNSMIEKHVNIGKIKNIDKVYQWRNDSAHLEKYFYRKDNKNFEFIICEEKGSLFLFIISNNEYLIDFIFLHKNNKKTEGLTIHKGWNLYCLGSINDFNFDKFKIMCDNEIIFERNKLEIKEDMEFGELKWLKNPFDGCINLHINSKTEEIKDLTAYPYETMDIINENINTRYVCIAIQSTSQCKYWNYPGGWDIIVKYLKDKGYSVKYISKEEGVYMGNPPPNGVEDCTGSSLEETIILLKNSKLFIGISSGLSWLAWAVGTPIIMISGFTAPWFEMSENCMRVHNPNVCNSCFNDPDIEFNRGDWNWCPRNKNFECSKSITPEMVIEKINKGLRINANG